jgi:hypothetical protein
MSDAARSSAESTATSSTTERGQADADAAMAPDHWPECRLARGWRRHALLWLGMSALTSVFWYAAFRRASSTGAHYDWRLYLQMWETMRVGIQRFGELPLWNPYQCGGVTIWGNPQSWLFSPLFYPALLVGTAVAMKARMLLLCTLGLVGMYVLARRVHRISPIGSLLAAVPWACSGFFSWHNLAGHAAFQSIWLFPWVLYLSRRAERDGRFCAANAAVIFFMAVDGASYPLPYLALLLCADTLFRLLAAKSARERLRITVALGWTGVLALSLSALVIIPSLTRLARMPRNLGDSDALNLGEVLTILTARQHEWRFDPHTSWHEYACFVGWGVLISGLLGFLLTLKKQPVLAAGAAFFFLCMLGDVAPYFPWPLLERLPVLGSLHIQSRFVVLFTLYLTLLGGLFLDGLRTRLSRVLPSRYPALPSLIAAALTAGAIVDLFVVNVAVNDLWRGRDLPTEAPRGRYHLVAPVSVSDFRAAFAGFPQQGFGSTQCDEPLPWPVPQGLWTGDVPQARVLGEGRVLDWGQTTNTVWTEIDLSAPGRVVFNQTFAPGWQSTLGSVVEDAGLLALDVEAGRQRIELRYRPPEMAVSIATTLLGAVLTLLTAALARPERLTRFMPRRQRT